MLSCDNPDELEQRDGLVVTRGEGFVVLLSYKLSDCGEQL